MASKIRVYGKAQNRTALGIVRAYMVMHPDTTLADLRRAFPNDLCPDSGVKELLLPLAEAATFNTKMSLYFAKPDEVITTGDGAQVCLCQVWSKTSFDKIVAQGASHDIDVAEFEKTMKGEKGGYRLEYLNGYMPPAAPAKKKGVPGWLWAIIAIIVIVFIAVLFATADKA